MTTILQTTTTNFSNPIFATENLKQTTSKKYKFKSSQDIIDRLESHGFELVNTSFGKPRKIERRGFQKHIMVFERSDLAIDSENKFQLLVTNSHDGKSSLKFNVGIYRTICANGLIVGSTFSEERIRHTGINFNEEVDNALYKIVASLPKIVETVKKMQSVKLNEMQKLHLINDMANTRIKELDTPVFSKALDINREGDKGNDLYTLYNVMQEKLIRGGLEVLTVRKDKKTNENVTKLATLRRLKSIDAINKVNQELWNIAEKMVA